MSAIREPLQSSDATVNGAFGLGQRARENAGMLSLVRTRPLPSDRRIPAARLSPFARRGTSRLTGITCPIDEF